MKKMFKSWQLIALCVFMITAVSCNKDKVKKDLLGGKGNILIDISIKNSDGMSGQSYIKQVYKFSGVIDTKDAVQIGAFSSVVVKENDVYIFPEFGAKGSQFIKKYKRTENGLKKLADLQVPPQSYPNNITMVNSDKAYIPLYSLGQVMVVNPQTMKQIGIIDLKQYSHTDQSAEPSYGIVRDGYYYLALDQIGPKWMPYEDYLQSDVAVINTKTDKVEKVISENTSGLAFPTRPFLGGMIFTNEQNDIYIACCGYFGYNPTYTKSGFICIPANQQDFDTSRSWDISNTTIEGTSYKPATVYNTIYLGDNKIAAYVGIMELNGSNPFTAHNTMAVIIDLNAKTIKKVNGIPLTDGHSVYIDYYKGDVYFAAFGKDESGIYKYNLNSDKVEHLCSAIGNISLFHFFE